jgi:chromosome segregation ATPase
MIEVISTLCLQLLTPLNIIYSIEAEIRELERKLRALVKAVESLDSGSSTLESQNRAKEIEIEALEKEMVSHKALRDRTEEELWAIDDDTFVPEDDEKMKTKILHLHKVFRNQTAERILLGRNSLKGKIEDIKNRKPAIETKVRFWFSLRLSLYV